MQSFERAGHRSGTAPTHQLAPPTTRVASRLIGCPPGFAHGRPRWPRSRAGRPTGPPPPAPPPRSRSDRNGETRPRAHDWEARTSRSAEPACGDPRSALRAFTRRAPLAEFLERHSTRVLAGSNGAPPSMSAQTWSSVRSRVGCAGCSGPSPGQHVAVLADVARDHPLGQAGPSCIRMDVVVGTDARQARMLAAASSRSARDDTADRAELHPQIVDGLAGAVYSPAVLRLRDQPLKAHGVLNARCT